MKLLYLTYTFLLALASMPSMADELPTCLWLHLDQDTRVYQCSVLPPEVTPGTDLIAESLPDPTQPIAQQAAVQTDSMANIIPDFLRESITYAEPSSVPIIAPVTVPVKTPVIDPIKATTIDPIKATTIDPIAATTIDPIAAITIDPITAITIDPVKATTIDPITAITIDPVKATTIDPITAITIDPVKATTIDPITAITIDPVKATTIDPVKATTIDPMLDTMVAESAVDSFSSTQKIVVVANGEIESVKALMQASGDVHFYVLPTSGRLSLGIYSITEYAKRRQAAMLIMGIESELMMLGTGELSNVTPTIKRQIEADVPSVLEPSSKSGLAPSSKSSSAPISKSGLKNESQKSSRRNNAVGGYLVATVGSQEDLVAELKRISVTDFVELTADPYRDRVSLGVYSVYENALARQNYFKQLGIDSDLISRNESTVVRSTLPTTLPIEQEIKVDDVPYGYNQIALQPLDI